MNLHIVNDEKFIKSSIDTFEKYYPGKNIFIVQKSNSKSWKSKYVSEEDGVQFLSLTNKSDIKQISKIVKEKNVKNIFVHYLTNNKAVIANKLKSEHKGLRTYWIFYGADLYSILNKEYNYVLHDDAPKALKDPFLSKLKSRLKFLLFYGALPFKSYKKFIRELDYFCFWTVHDFILLKKYFETNAEFKDFGYYEGLDTDLSINVSQQDKVNIIINNSASKNGNHKTIFDKLNTLEISTLNKVVVPLSYGDTNYKDYVLNYGKAIFGEKFHPLVDFMPKDEYFKTLSDIDVAFYGARRQEAAGNIYFLLGLGVKVFLREDNNMTAFLRDNGFIFFVFEKDLNSADDIAALTESQKLINNRAYKTFYNPEKHHTMMKTLITNTGS